LEHTIVIRINFCINLLKFALILAYLFQGNGSMRFIIYYIYLCYSQILYFNSN